MKKTVLLLFAVFLLTACGTMKYHVGRYDISLQSVENHIGDGSNSKLSFIDDAISITWTISLKRFNFTLTNLSDNPIKIIWDSAIYVDTDGASGRVMHDGVKYTEANNSHPPTTIMGNSFISDIVIPTKNIYYETNRYMLGWKENYLLPTVDREKERIETIGNNMVDKKIKILLPIEIEGKVNNYTFIFNINTFTMVP